MGVILITNYITMVVFLDATPTHDTPKYLLQPIDKFFLVVTGTMKRGEIPKKSGELRFLSLDQMTVNFGWMPQG